MKRARVHGTDLAYVDRGEGPPALLIHGFPLDHALWSAQIERLAPRWRIIAPDLRGFGQSPSDAEKTTMREFADDLAALLVALEIDEPIVCCGLSMGGYVALQFWRHHPNRLRGLALCNTRAGADAPDAAAARYEMADRVLREGSGPLAETMLPRLLGKTTQRTQPAWLERLGDGIRASEPRGFAAALRGMADRPDMTAALKQIVCPTLVIAGEEDVVSPPEEMHAMAAAIAGSKYVEIPAAGHLSPLENPAAFNAALSAFLASLPSTPQSV